MGAVLSKRGELLRQKLMERNPLARNSRELQEYGSSQSITAQEDLLTELPLSVTAKFLFWLMQNNFLESAILRAIAHVPQRIFFSPPATGVRLTNKQAIKRWHAWRDFFTGRDMMIDFMWSPIFLALFFRDVVDYSQDPAGRYGKTAVDLLFGMQASETLLTATMIESFPTAPFLWRPLLLLMLPILSGVTYSVLNHSRFCGKGFAALQCTITSGHLYYSQRARYFLLRLLDQFEAEILISALENDTAHQVCRDKIISVAKEHSGIEGWHATAMLYRLLVVQLSHTKGAISEEQQQNTRNLKKALGEIDNKGGLKGCYAHYLLWLRQHGHRRGAHLHVFTVTLLSYMRLRYWLALVWASKIAIEHLVSWAQCDAVWQYVYELNEYVCAICPDWEQAVSVNSLDDAAACLTQYINAAELSVTEICSAIQRLQQQFTPEASIDLAVNKLHWIELSESEWSMLRSCLNQLAQLVNLSQINISAVGTQPAQELGYRIADLSPFAEGWLDLSRQILSPESSAFIRFSNKLQHLWLANMALQPSQVALLLGRLNQTAVADLDLRGNHLGTMGITALIEILPQLPLTRLVLSGCDFVEENFIALLQALAESSSLQELDVSDISLSVAMMTEIGKLCCTGLQVLRMNNAELSDEHLQVLAPYLAENSTLQQLHLAENAFFQEGMHALGQALQSAPLYRLVLDESQLDESALIALFSTLAGSALRQLSLRHLSLTAGALLSLAEHFPETRLDTIDLAKNTLDVTALTAFANATLTLKNSSALSISLENTALTDASLQWVTDIWKQLNVTLDLDVGHNLLTDVSGSSLAALINSGVGRLGLSENYFTDNACQAVSDVLPNSQLTTLDFSGNALGASCVENLAKVWHLSVLQVLSLRDNAVNGGIVALMKHLSTMPHAGALAHTRPNGDWRHFFYHHARAATSAVSLDLRGTLMDSAEVLASCRIFNLLRQQQPNFAIDYDASTESWSSVNPMTCAVSSATRLDPFIILLAVLAFWVFHYFSPQAENNTRHSLHFGR